MTSRHVADKLGAAVAPGERFETFGRAQRCGELGAEIAFAFVGRANVRQNQLFEVGVERPRLISRSGGMRSPSPKISVTAP